MKRAGKQFRASWLRKATQTDCRVVPALKGQGTQPAGYERHPHTYSDLRWTKGRFTPGETVRSPRAETMIFQTTTELIPHGIPPRDFRDYPGAVPSKISRCPCRRQVFLM